MQDVHKLKYKKMHVVFACWQEELLQEETAARNKQLQIRTWY